MTYKDELNLSQSAGFFDRDLGVIELRGEDRLSWLQGMVSNDVSQLKPGQGCYAAHLNSQGRVMSHMVVLINEDFIWLKLEKQNIENTIEKFGSLLIMEDVEISSLIDEFSILTLVGGNAVSLLDRSSESEVTFESYADHKIVGHVRVVLGDLGYDLIVPNTELEGVRTRLEKAGCSAGASEVWEQLRIEAGLPVYGVDINEKTTLPEIGEKSINYEKGCYIGQEVVAKIKYIGHVNRRLVGLKLEGFSLPAPGTSVRVSDREVGQITSSVHSVALNSGIALAIMRYGSDRAGTKIEVATDDIPQTAIVVDLPFVLHDDVFQSKNT